MAINDSASQRLFLSAPFEAGRELDCTPEQANYLLNVLRLANGDGVRVFNGTDGEWAATLALTGRKRCRMVLAAPTRPQQAGPDVDYLFAPLKHARLDYMVQKATEMGVRRLRPVITKHTIAQRVNLDRMRANAIEAAEQCGLLAVPDVSVPVQLDRALDTWDPARTLIFCDETQPHDAPLAPLETLPQGPLAVLIGPEGGFHATERDRLRALPFTRSLSLGPRIMRADTAAVAALALVNAIVGKGW